MDPRRMPERAAWIAEYEVAAARFAACHYLESVGSGRVDAVLGPVIELHDRESRALSTDISLA